MSTFVFRNNTVERFFPKDYQFSGYDDISAIPDEIDTFVWFYQVPFHYNQTELAEEIKVCSRKFEMVVRNIGSSKPIIALTMCNLSNFTFTDTDRLVNKSIVEYNEVIYGISRSSSNVKIIDFSEFVSQYSIEELIDWKYYFLSQMGLNPKLTKSFQKWWNKKMESLALKRKKCLVLDLDNTLWGGVLGEDGIENLRIGGDYPGKAFLYFQAGLKELSRNGVILTVCSKNNESDVLEAWDSNPFLLLRKDDFSAYRINWQDKAANIKELAIELNIGLDSMVFIDDNPTERELVRQMLPMVSVPDFPSQPYELPSFFKELVENYFKVYSLTDEDKYKKEQYLANVQRNQAQKGFENFDDYLSSLQINLIIEQASEFSIPRIAQMTQKTNQFNLTTKRYTEADVRSFSLSGWKIWSISVSDRFGDSGITGVIMITPQYVIDTFLLSCRILGKGIEFAFVNTVLSILKKENIEIVGAYYSPTSKNAQVKSFYESCGFQCVKTDAEGTKWYSLMLPNINFSSKEYYNITIK